MKLALGLFLPVQSSLYNSLKHITLCKEYGIQNVTKVQLNNLVNNQANTM